MTDRLTPRFENVHVDHDGHPTQQAGAVGRLAEFQIFLMTEIFPGGQLPSIGLVNEHAVQAGFTPTRIQSLQQHYAMPLDRWAQALETHECEAIGLQSEDVYDRYLRYLTGCAEEFRAGRFDVNQFTLVK